MCNIFDGKQLKKDFSVELIYNVHFFHHRLIIYQTHFIPTNSAQRYATKV